MSSVSLTELLFDPADVDEGPAIGAYLVGANGGVLDDIVGDAAGTVAQTGLMTFGLRQDAAGSPVSADGDYHPLVFDNDGQLKVAANLISTIGDDDADSGNPIKIGYRAHDADSALTALSADSDRSDALSDLYRRVFINDAPNIGAFNQAVSVDTTAGGVALPASPLAGKTRMMIQNKGAKSIFIGTGTVTAVNGIELPKGGIMNLETGPAIVWKAIAFSGSQDTRILEWG